MSENYLPCPFCGGEDLRVVDWADETGEYPAIECAACLGTCPADRWNNRADESAPLRAMRNWLFETEQKACEYWRSIQDNVAFNKPVRILRNGCEYGYSLR